MRVTQEAALTLPVQLLLEAIPKAEADQGRRYRGFIAIDDIQFRAGDECSGHCTFDSGLCKFSNDPNGNFEWQVVRYLLDYNLYFE